MRYGWLNPKGEFLSLEGSTHDKFIQKHGFSDPRPEQAVRDAINAGWVRMHASDLNKELSFQFNGSDESYRHIGYFISDHPETSNYLIALDSPDGFVNELDPEDIIKYGAKRAAKRILVGAGFGANYGESKTVKNYVDNLFTD